MSQKQNLAFVKFNNQLRDAFLYDLITVSNGKSSIPNLKSSFLSVDFLQFMSYLNEQYGCEILILHVKSKTKMKKKKRHEEKNAFQLFTEKKKQQKKQYSTKLIKKQLDFTGLHRVELMAGKTQ